MKKLKLSKSVFELRDGYEQIIYKLRKSYHGD